MYVKILSIVVYNLAIFKCQTYARQTYYNFYFH